MEKVGEIENYFLSNEYKIKQLEYKAEIEINNELQEREDYENKIIRLTESKKLREIVIMFIASRQRQEAVDMLIKDFLKKNYIYTIRKDENPDMYIYNKGIYIQEGRTFINEYCEDILGKATTKQIINEVIFRVEAKTYIDEKIFFKESDPNEICIKNGILNLKTLNLREYDPKTIFFNKINIDFIKNIDCPAIKKHFEVVLESKKDVPVIQELFGYCLYRDYFIEKAFMLSGSGRNGKGKSLELLKIMLGADNCSNIPLETIEKDTFAIINLHKKLANIGADISPTALRNTGNFKSLCGHDLISANRKNQEYLHFVNYAKLIFCANELPQSADNTVAFWNRWILLNFPYTFLLKEEYDKLEDKTNHKIADPEHIAKLTDQQELTGLLNWAIEGLQRLFKNKEFSFSQTTEVVKENWIRKADSFRAFCMDYLIEDWEGKIEKKSLKQTYALYCKKYKLKIGSDKGIKSVLSETFGVIDSKRNREDGMQVHCWEGIKYIQGIQDINGFSTYLGNLISKVSIETVDKVDTLDIQEELVGN